MKKIFKKIKKLKDAKLQQKRIVLIAIVTFTVALAITLTGLLIHLGYNLTGTGFNAQVETVKPGQQIQPAKTLWDWMQLLVVPIFLIIGAFILNLTINKNEQNIAQKRFEIEHKIAVSTQQENLLQTYLDRMTDLLLQGNLRASKPNSEVRNVARARTTTVISRLEGSLQKNLLQFLREADLIKNSPEGNIISLEGVTLEDSNLDFLDLNNSNLKGIRIQECELYTANFNGSNMNNADIWNCNLEDANFRGVSFIDGYLTQSVLSGADFSKANLHKTKLARAILEDTNLTMSNLSETSLNSAWLHLANLSKANLSDADLTGANLIKVNLKEAILVRTNLSKANLSNADLTGADLTGADLTGADLTGVVLESAIITQEQLLKAKQYPKKGYN